MKASPAIQEALLAHLEKITSLVENLDALSDQQIAAALRSAVEQLGAAGIPASSAVIPTDETRARPAQKNLANGWGGPSGWARRETPKPFPWPQDMSAELAKKRARRGY